MSCPLCDRVKNSEYPYLIHEYKNSYLYLGEHQYYQGYCVQVSKTHYREMTDMPVAARTDFFQELMTSHEIIQKVFNPKKMNLCSLGNVVDHIHWHFFPRYADDQNFMNPPWLQMQYFDEHKISDSKRGELIAMLKPFFKDL